jgi:hypothetical protein
MTSSPLDRLRWADLVVTKRLPANAYRLAVHLAYVAVHGTAWSSRPSIARDLNIDEARLPNAFAALVNAGLLKRGTLRGPSGRQTFEWIFVIPPAEVAGGAEVAGAPPAEVATYPLRKSQGHPLRKSPPKGGIQGGIEGGINKGGKGGRESTPDGGGNNSSAKTVSTDNRTARQATGALTTNALLAAKRGLAADRNGSNGHQQANTAEDAWRDLGWQP